MKYIARAWQGKKKAFIPRRSFLSFLSFKSIDSTIVMGETFTLNAVPLVYMTETVILFQNYNAMQH